jgi:hypothetical protein
VVREGREGGEWKRKRRVEREEGKRRRRIEEKEKGREGGEWKRREEGAEEVMIMRQ